MKESSVWADALIDKKEWDNMSNCLRGTIDAESDEHPAPIDAEIEKLTKQQ